jgi:Na+/H+ antiporter NhaA
MAAIARVLSRASGTEVDVETLKTVIMFCGVGFTVSMLVASYGVDLSQGFF